MHALAACRPISSARLHVSLPLGRVSSLFQPTFSVHGRAFALLPPVLSVALLPPWPVSLLPQLSAELLQVRAPVVPSSPWQVALAAHYLPSPVVPASLLLRRVPLAPVPGFEQLRVQFSPAASVLRGCI